MPYLVYKVFFVSCDSCYPRGAPAPFHFMIMGRLCFPRLLYIIKGNVPIVVTDDIRWYIRWKVCNFVFYCLTIPIYINTQPPTPPIFWYVGRKNTVGVILIIVWCVYINKCISLWSYLFFNSIIYNRIYFFAVTFCPTLKDYAVSGLFKLYLSTLDKSLHLLIRGVKKNRDITR